MRKSAGRVVFSPSDLIRFLASPFASWMDRLHLENPEAVSSDESSDDEKLIAQTGDEHEHAVLGEFKAESPGLVEVPKEDLGIARERGHIDWDSGGKNRYDGPGITISPGDLLFSCLNPKETRVCVIPQDFNGTIAASPEFAVLNLNTGTKTPFLLAAILRSNFLGVQTSFLTRSSSLSRRRLQEDDLAFVTFPWLDKGASQLETKLAVAVDAQVESDKLVRKAIAAVEALIDETLDQKALLAESGEIEKWVQAHPSPYASK